MTKIKIKGTSERIVPDPDPLPPVPCAHATDSISIMMFLSYQALVLSNSRRLNIQQLD
jgi:hypothetical protein